MLISLHKNATTTPATRLALQQASGTDRALAQQYGIGVGPVRKWRGRTPPHAQTIHLLLLRKKQLLAVGSRTIGYLKTSVRCCMAERYFEKFWQHGKPVPRSCHADQSS